MAKRVKVKGRTAPSSTRKELVKEGSRKFIGPRRPESEFAENMDQEARAGGEVLVEGDDGELSVEWMKGPRYAILQPNRKQTRLERAQKRTRSRQIDVAMEPIDGISYIPKALRNLIKSKIKDQPSRDRMFKVLARALSKRGGKPSDLDLNKDLDRAFQRGETEYPF
jgi:hypothetical protein